MDFEILTKSPILSSYLNYHHLSFSPQTTIPLGVLMAVWAQLKDQIDVPRPHERLVQWISNNGIFSQRRMVHLNDYIMVPLEILLPLSIPPPKNSG